MKERALTVPEIMLIAGTRVALGVEGHWNSPIVVDGKITLPEGNANRHATTGVLDIWSLPTVR